MLRTAPTGHVRSSVVVTLPVIRAAGRVRFGTLTHIYGTVAVGKEAEVPGVHG